MVREGRNMDFEHRLVMPDGSIKYVHLVLQNTADDTDSPEFVGAVLISRPESAPSRNCRAAKPS